MEYVVGQQVAPGLVVVHEDTLRMLRDANERHQALQRAADDELKRLNLQIDELRGDVTCWHDQAKVAEKQAEEWKKTAQEQGRVLESQAAVVEELKRVNAHLEEVYQRYSEKLGKANAEKHTAERLLGEAKALLQRFLDAGPEEEYEVILCKLSGDVEKFFVNQQTDRPKSEHEWMESAESGTVCKQCGVSYFSERAKQQCCSCASTFHATFCPLSTEKSNPEKACVACFAAHNHNLKCDCVCHCAIKRNDLLTIPPTLTMDNVLKFVNGCQCSCHQYDGAKACGCCYQNKT